MAVLEIGRPGDTDQGDALLDLFRGERRLDLLDGERGEFLAGVTEWPAGRVVEFGEAMRRDVDQHDAVRCLVDDRAVDLLAPLQRSLLRLARADVTGDCDHDAAAADARAARAHLDVVHRAVPAPVPCLEDGVDRCEVREPGTDLRLGHVRVVVPRAHAEHFRGGAAEHRSECGVRLDDAVVLVDDRDAVVGVVDQHPKTFGSVGEGLRGRLLFGDVAPDTDEVVAVVLPDGPDAGLHVDDPAVLAAMLRLELQLPGRDDRGSSAGQGVGGQLGLDVGEPQFENLVACVSEDPAPCRIHLHVAQCLDIDEIDRVGSLADDRLRERLGVALRRLDEPPVGDVADHADGADGLSVGAGHELCLRMQPLHAVIDHDAMFDVVATDALRRLTGSGHAVTIVRMYPVEDDVP